MTTVDYDLDVYNALREFPKDNNHAVIYISMNENDNTHSFIMRGVSHVLLRGITGAMEESEIFADVVRTAGKIKGET